jgi:hypothetical protein
MTLRIDVDLRDRLAVPRVERSAHGALQLTLNRGAEQVALRLSYPSLEALWFELTVALAEIRRC